MVIQVSSSTKDDCTVLNNRPKDLVIFSSLLFNAWMKHHRSHDVMVMNERGHFLVVCKQCSPEAYDMIYQDFNHLEVEQ